MFVPHYDICDLLLNTGLTMYNLQLILYSKAKANVNEVILNVSPPIDYK